MDINKVLYERLLNSKWLVNCGTNENTTYDFEVHSVKTEKEMKKYISSIKWENISLEEDGNLSEFLSVNHKDIYNNCWNPKVRLIKKEYIPAILKKIEEDNSKTTLTAKILDDIKANVVSILMADYYSEYYKSDFFDKLLNIYTSGHLPCGWHGSYPEGKIMIY
jgi:hypothetical protein